MVNALQEALDYEYRMWVPKSAVHINIIGSRINLDKEYAADFPSPEATIASDWWAAHIALALRARKGAKAPRVIRVNGWWPNGKRKAEVDIREAGGGGRSETFRTKIFPVSASVIAIEISRLGGKGPRLIYSQWGTISREGKNIGIKHWKQPALDKGYDDLAIGHKYPH